MTQQTRKLLFVLALTGIVIAGLSLASIISAREVRLRGALNGLPGPELPFRVPITGVNVELTQYDADQLDENLELIASGGFVWLRQVFAWDAIERQPGEYDWSAYDRIVMGATEHDLRLVAVLWRSPDWAADSPTAPPGDLDSFAAYAGALAGRYGDQIDVYQIWDEPNLASGWGGQPPDSIGYAALLEAAYSAIHAADPDALVLTAGLAPTTETGPENLSDILFLRALYQNGAAAFFDGVAGKPYGFDTGPDDRRVDPGLLNFSRFILLREEMERFGDANKPLWASHFGWNALPADWQGEPSTWSQTTPEMQAQMTLAAYRRALLEWPWVGALILENWQPDVSSNDSHWGFALRFPDGTLSPTANILAGESDLLTGSLWPGVYQAQTPLADYRGQWEFSDLGADIVENGDSAVDIPFLGDQLAVIARRADYRAYLYVTVDGQSSSVLPQDERGAYLVLTSADYQPHTEMLTIAEGLNPADRHEAHIEAERGWDQWALAGFAVGAHVDTRLYDGFVIVLAGAIVAMSWAGIRLGWSLVPDWDISRVLSGFTRRLGENAQLVLSLIATFALWLGMALTWGGTTPNLIRRMGDNASLLLTALTAGVFYFSPSLLFTLLALLILFVLIFARPSIGLALIMAFTPYYLYPRELFDRALSLLEVTTLLTLAAWLIHTLADFRKNGWPSPVALWRSMTMLDKAVSLFIAVAIISLSWADLLGVAVTDLRQMVLEPVVIYLVLRTTPLTAQERWRIVDLLIITGTVIALYGFLQLATGTGLIVAEGGAIRLRSVFGTPNNAALYLGRLIPIAGAVALIGGQVWRRCLYAFAGLLMLAAAGLTLSKGFILLGLPAALAVIVVFWLGRPGAILAAAGAILEATILIPLSRLPRFNDLLDFSSGTSSSFFRLQLWQSTLRMLRDHPLTGVGLDQFLYQYRSRYILPEAWQQPDLSQPHNFLLNYWVRLGLVGLAAAIWMQVAFWKIAIKTQGLLKAAHPDERALVVGLMAGMADMIAHGMVDETHFVIDLAFIFFMSLGLVHQLSGEEGDGDQDRRANTPVD